MLNLNEAGGEVLELTEKKQESRPAAERRRPKTLPRRPPVRSMAWQSTALFSLCVLFVAAIGLAFYAFQRAIVLEDRLRDTVGEMQAGLQELKASVQFDSTRQQLLLGIRDEILRVNEEISLGEAYNYAELLMAATDNIPPWIRCFFFRWASWRAGFRRTLAVMPMRGASTRFGPQRVGCWRACSAGPIPTICCSTPAEIPRWRRSIWTCS